MPPFRKAAPSPEPEAQPEPSAAERYAALASEHAQINATLEEHRTKRAELLRENDEFDAIRALAREDEALKLRLEQIALRLPGIEQELAQQRREEFEAAWLLHRPGLAEAEADLVEAIKVFQRCLERANTLYGRAQNFGERLQEFVRPPPPSPVYNDYSLRQYVDVVERRRGQVPAAWAPMLEMVIDAPLLLPAAKRFVPKRVPVAELEAISAIAPPRTIKILHGPCRVSNLQLGIARMFPGEEHHVPARAAHALVASGIAEYIDVDTATTAAA